MKRKLNILYLLTFIVLFSSVIGDLYSGIKAFEDGWSDGGNIKGNSYQSALVKDRYNSADVHFQFAKTNSNIKIRNEKTGKDINIWLNEIDIPHSDSTLLSIMSLFIIIPVIAALWAVVVFIKLIISINKDEGVFNKRNIRRLRTLGILLLIYAVYVSIFSFLNVYAAAQEVTIKGCSIDYSECFELRTILLALISLIASRIFANGLRMREEQELTI